MVLFCLTTLWPDFTDLFNWNTKQLFVYVLATYQSKIYVSFIDDCVLEKLFFFISYFFNILASESDSPLGQDHPTRRKGRLGFTRRRDRVPLPGRRQWVQVSNGTGKNGIFLLTCVGHLARCPCLASAGWNQSGSPKTFVCQLLIPGTNVVAPLIGNDSFGWYWCHKWSLALSDSSNINLCITKPCPKTLNHTSPISVTLNILGNSLTPGGH